MYFSEFTLKLIDEVKKHEVLYNTKYDKRPKQEKEEAWIKIAGALSDAPEKCKKHWKNIRDRFVKVMHQRDRHFFQGGSEVDAPQYIYFEKLLFMREFSVKKDPKVSAALNSDSDVVFSPDTPERLAHVEEKTGEILDYTDQFLQLVKEFPVLYDEKAEMKRYRDKDAYKQISEALDRISIGKLRAYWQKLMRQYKFAFKKSQNSVIENDPILSKMTFVNVGISKEISDYSQHIEDDYNDREYLENFSDGEHYICEELDDDEDENEEEEIHFEETTQAVENIESFDVEVPEAKKIKIDLEESSTIEVLEEKTPQPQSTMQRLQISAPSCDDEYDYFGKKVAMQLREIAQKNRSIARKGEIKVLQLLMELEESIES